MSYKHRDFILQRLAALRAKYPDIPFVTPQFDYVFPSVLVKSGQLLIDGEPTDLAAFIDHTDLAQAATESGIAKLCAEATEHNFAAVCVNGAYAAQCVAALKGTPVKVCCVVGFPLGNVTAECKRFEAEQLVLAGAQEIDSVLRCGSMLDGRYQLVYEEIDAISQVCRQHGATHKVIIEAACLETDELICDACLICMAAHADFVKTSTGMHKNGGARGEHVRLMRETVGKLCGVKAAGGIRDTEKALEMIQNGASRIGASAGIKIVEMQ